MGVLSCSRKDCDNIMCDTYVDGIGYICFDCQREFKEYAEKEIKDLNTEGKIKRALEKFIGTSKDSFSEGKNITIDDFFTSHTR